MSKQITIDKTKIMRYVYISGFPIKDARFTKLKNISDLLSDDKEGKIKENMD